MQNVNKQILEYQKTGDELILNKLYQEYESVLTNIANFRSNTSSYDFIYIYSDLFMLFLSCLKNFNPNKNTKFKTYFISSSNFMFRTYENKKYIEVGFDEKRCSLSSFVDSILEIRLSGNNKLLSVYKLIKDGLSVEDIVKLLGISKSTAYRRISEIKKILTKVIEDYEN